MGDRATKEENMKKLDPSVNYALRLNGVHPDCHNGSEFTPRAGRILARVIKAHKRVNGAKRK